MHGHPLSIAWLALVLGAFAGIMPCRMLSADEKQVFFESSIRPLLETHCIDCHSGQDPKAGLDLSYRDGWHSAGVIEPGRPTASLLMELLRSTDPDRIMPPPDSNLALSSDEIARFEQWIASGAYDPRDTSPSSAAPSTGPAKRNRIFEITPEDRAYWAFQPIADPTTRIESEAVPSARKSASQWIDTLVAEKLTTIPGGRISPRASPRELVRRAYFDLWGLPPSPEVVAAFERDPSDAAWSAMIDSLLASHHYGERWGRYWLDWVRYAETNGYERDGPKPHAWRYRDYVIASFANDKPYDQFVVEQLAGDAWSDAQGWSATHEPERWREAIIATGFYRLHQWDDEPDNADQAELDDADDVLVSIGTAFLGLTIGCARCHDHKFDPISQRDYYSMLSSLRGIDPYGLPKKGGGGRGTGRIQKFLVSDAISNSWEHERQQKIAHLQQTLAETSDPAIRLGLEGQIKSQQDAVPPFDAALTVANRPGGATPTFILHRGNLNSPREEVAPAIPAILVEQLTAPKLSEEQATGLERRMQLASWIASPGNPLTARVMANRIWQRHFGMGIVSTPDDFGRTGSPPSNLPLLDFLAAEFIRSGWSVHQMHRAIMNSEAYRMASHVKNPEAALADPDATLFWRQHMRRLDAEAIRDSILVIAGSLNNKRHGPSVFPSLSQEVRDTANPVSVASWTDSPAEEQNCRSVYLVVKRSLKTPFLETLDFANSSSPAGLRPVTTTAPQALLLLNDPWVHAQAAALLRRIRSESHRDDSARDDSARDETARDESARDESARDETARIDRLWQLVHQRSPSPQEMQNASSFLVSQQRNIDPNSPVSADAAWLSLCRALLNSNEMIYID